MRSNSGQGPGLAEGREETFASHGEYSEAGPEVGPVVSRKFETEPEKYLEEKLLAALMEQLLGAVAEEMAPALATHTEMLGGGVGEGGAGWEQQLLQLKSLSLRGRGRRDSIEEDSIFSLGKIVMSPR